MNSLFTNSGDKISNLAGQMGAADAHAHVVLQFVVEHVHRLGRGDEVDAVVGRVSDVEARKERRFHHRLHGR